MTLATIFLLGYFLTPSAKPLPTAGLQPSAPIILQNTQDAQGQPAPTQSQGEGKQNAAGAPAKPQAGQQTTAAKPHRRRKKKTATDCATLPPPNSTTASTDAGKKPAADGAGAQTSANGKPAKNCPPATIVVRHGGTTDPSIQLAGGATGGQAAQQKATANQMLASTEENLKKLEGRQLSASDQATVNQIRQFVEQSKTAITSNDMERARTLAWKAQTLSDDLVNPKQ
ncbi:MAG TPA: hypothetical protein VGS78_13980 [Candidatus Sulfotelmatobacter sp.]|nr:hypothetical protein [Candidatus Sulfotelmatobacter sp.]